jgi:hypothetical protein
MKTTRLGILIPLITILSSPAALACDEHDAPGPGMDREIGFMAGQWYPGELLGVACGRGDSSAFGYRMDSPQGMVRDFEVGLSEPLCERLVHEQEKAQELGVADAFNTRVWVHEETGSRRFVAVAFEAFLPGHAPVLDPALDAEERGRILRARASQP